MKKDLKLNLKCETTATQRGEQTEYELEITPAKLDQKQFLKEVHATVATDLFEKLTKEEFERLMTKTKKSRLDLYRECGFKLEAFDNGFLVSSAMVDRGVADICSRK